MMKHEIPLATGQGVGPSHAIRLVRPASAARRAGLPCTVALLALLALTFGFPWSGAAQEPDSRRVTVGGEVGWGTGLAPAVMAGGHARVELRRRLRIQVRGSLWSQDFGTCVTKIPMRCQGRLAGLTAGFGVRSMEVMRIRAVADGGCGVSYFTGIEQVGGTLWAHGVRPACEAGIGLTARLGAGWSVRAMGRHMRPLDDETYPGSDDRLRFRGVSFGVERRVGGAGASGSGR